jgi:hypothetical protein
MIFVSVPYSHTYPEIVELRVKVLSIYCGQLMKNGIITTSPVLFGVTLLKHYNLPSDFGYWSELSYQYLELCSEIHVLLMDGWKESSGVQGEIERANELGIPIKFINVYKHDDLTYHFSENEKEQKKEEFIKRLKEAKVSIDASLDEDNFKLKSISNNENNTSTKNS